MGLCLPLLPEAEKLGNDALQPGNRHGFGNKNLDKSILFIKKKIFGGSGTCLFPQKQGPRDAWEGGCWELLVLSESPVSDPFLLEIKNRPGWTTRVNRL